MVIGLPGIIHTTMKWSVKPCFPHHFAISDFPTIAGETWTTYLAPMRWGQWDELIGLKGESLEILLMLCSKSGGKTSWGWQFIPLSTRFYTSQVVVWDFFHQQYQFQPPWMVFYIMGILCTLYNGNQVSFYKDRLGYYMVLTCPNYAGALNNLVHSIYKKSCFTWFNNSYHYINSVVLPGSEITIIT